MSSVRDILSDIVLQLSRHKLRSLLTGLSVLWGTFALTVLLASGDALKRRAVQVFSRDAINTIYMHGGQLSVPSGGRGIGAPVQLRSREIEQLPTRVSGIISADPTAGPQGKVRVSQRNQQGSFFLRGCELGHLRLEAAELLLGRYFHARDLMEHRKVAVIGKEVRDQLFGMTHDPVGAELAVAGVAYRVIGVFDDDGDDHEQQTVYVPLTTAQLLHVESDSLQDVWLELDMAGGASPREVERSVRRALGSSYGFAESDEEALPLYNRYALFQRIERILMGIEGLNWILGLGTLLAGIVAVSNITLISVRERITEIGICKALGATPRRILFAILAESLFITLVAGYLGVLLSVGALHFLSRSNLDAFKDPRLDLRIIVINALVLVATGLIAGFTPARRAAKAPVVDSLRGGS